MTDINWLIISISNNTITYWIIRVSAVSHCRKYYLLNLPIIFIVDYLNMFGFVVNSNDNMQ